MDPIYFSAAWLLVSSLAVNPVALSQEQLKRLPRLAAVTTASTR